MRSILLNTAACLAATGLLHGCGGSGSGSESPPATALDRVAPVLLVETPVDGSLTREPRQSIRGRLSEPASLTVNGIAAVVDTANRFSFGPATLSEGTNLFELVAADPAGNRSSVQIVVRLDATAPAPARLDAVTRNSAFAGSVGVVGLPGSVEPGTTVVVRNLATTDSVSAPADDVGAFTASIPGEDTDALGLAVRDPAGNDSEQIVLEAPLPVQWRFGVIGDSIAAATHTNDMCGSGDELMSCLRRRLGAHDTGWSYAAGDQPWSLGRRAGYSASAILSAADDGAEWKDALAQAQLLFEHETGLMKINQVFIGLGSNDVCAEFGHDYAGDLESIAQHIENTMSYLSTAMAGRSGAAIYLSGTPDIVAFRNLMAGRQHDLAFTSCQALWDLDIGAMQSEARDSLCKGELGTVCEALPADLQRDLLDLLLDSVLDQNDVDEGPCGRVLSSANGAPQRLEAREYNLALNALIAGKAAEYDGRNGVRVLFSDALFATPLAPYMVSQIDCYHPSRAGQMVIANRIWKSFHSALARTDFYDYDGFDSTDKCTQEFTDWGGHCWVDGGEPNGFDSWIGDDGWYRLLKDTDNNVSHWVERSLGDLSQKSALWLSFRHQRNSMDDGGDRVNVQVYDADGGPGRLPGWSVLDVFQGPGTDVGKHGGQYYDLSGYLSADVRIRFQTNDARSMENGDGLKWDNITVFGW